LDTLLNPQAAEGRSIDAMKGLQARELSSDVRAAFWVSDGDLIASHEIQSVE